MTASAPVRVNLPLSRALRDNKWLGAGNGQCYRNCIRAMLFHFARGTRNLRYVEGYGITDLGMVVEHGWIEYNGLIVEPTPIWLKMARRSGRCGGRYFGGLYFTRSQLQNRELARKDAMLPLVIQHGHWQNEQYQQALKAANVACYGEEVMARLMSYKPTDFLKGGTDATTHPVV
jgi:hypothetical protein